MSQFLRRCINGAVNSAATAAIKQAYKSEVGRQILNEIASRPLFDGFLEENHYFPIDFQYNSLTITMLIKDEESDAKLMELVKSGELEKKLNKIISKLTTGIKIENLRILEKEVIKMFESFEELQKKAKDAAYSNPIIVPPSPLKVSCNGST